MATTTTGGLPSASAIAGVTLKKKREKDVKKYIICKKDKEGRCVQNEIGSKKKDN